MLYGLITFLTSPEFLSAWNTHSSLWSLILVIKLSQFIEMIVFFLNKYTHMQFLSTKLLAVNIFPIPSESHYQLFTLLHPLHILEKKNQIP